MQSSHPATRPSRSWSPGQELCSSLLPPGRIHKNIHCFIIYNRKEQSRDWARELKYIQCDTDLRLQDLWIIYFQVKRKNEKHCLVFWRLPWWLSGKEAACNAGDLGSNPGWGRSLGEGNGYPLQNSYLENLNGQRSLAGYSLCCRKELDMTEQLTLSFSLKWAWTHTHTHTHTSAKAQTSPSRASVPCLVSTYWRLFGFIHPQGPTVPWALVESHFAWSLDTPPDHRHANGAPGLLFMGPQEDPPGTLYCLQWGAHM